MIVIEEPEHHLYALRMTGMTMNLSLFDKLGGSAAVHATVEIFHTKILDDPKLKPFFKGVDMNDQKRKQRDFLTMAFGGPHNYDGQDLTEAHSYLVKMKGLSDEHFDAVAGHLQDTLTELDVPKDLAAEVMEIAGGTRDAVLGRKPKEQVA